MTTIYPGNDSPLNLLKRCDGYYNQVGTDGPLVGYAGTYDVPAVGGKKEEKQFVGRLYANFAKMERHGPVLKWCTDRLCHFLNKSASFTGFCGAPEGGKALATSLAYEFTSQYVFPDSEVVEFATATSRKKKKMFFDRHAPKEGEDWWLVEDVVNNASTPGKLIPLFDAVGAKVRGILCFLNRGEHDEYRHTDGRVLPIHAIERLKMPQYRQDDPEVADEVASGHVIWKPKDEWEKLKPYISA